MLLLLLLLLLLSLQDIATGAAGNIMTLEHVTAHKGSKSIDMTAMLRWSLKDGLISEVWEYVQDANEFKKFFIG